MSTNGRKWWWIGSGGIVGLVLAGTALVTFHRDTVTKIKAEGASQASLADRMTANEKAIVQIQEWIRDYQEHITRPRLRQLEDVDRRLSVMEGKMDQRLTALESRTAEIQADVREIRNRGRGGP